jgi:serine/threonine protein kinase
MAPEQDRGGTVGPPADVWGLGSVLFEAATGENPFEDVDQLEERAGRVRDVRPDADPALAAAIDACLEPEPGDRPALPELAAALG